MIEDNKYNVNIGELRIIKNPEEVAWTILGSCVSVIFHVRNDLALICHAQLPAPKVNGNKGCEICPCPYFTILSTENKYKYVSCSLQYMISYLKRNNIDLKSIKTTLVGGASTFNYSKDKSTFGELNVMKAKQILKKHGIKINREATGGNNGYTLWYYAKNNKLTLKKHREQELVNFN